jgi:hypothetical protein
MYVPEGGPSRARRERGGARPLPAGSAISVSLLCVPLPLSCCCRRWLCELLLSRLCRRRNRTITQPTASSLTRKAWLRWTRRSCTAAASRTPEQLRRRRGEDKDHRQAGRQQNTVAAPEGTRRQRSSTDLRSDPARRKKTTGSKESRNKGEGQGHVAHYYGYRYGRHGTWRIGGRQGGEEKADPAPRK